MTTMASDHIMTPFGEVEYMQLPPSVLKVDARTQRKYSPQRAKRMAAEWNPQGVGALHVSKRGDGYYVIDGQHRRGAAMIAGVGNEPVQCVVHLGLNEQQEAQLFNLLNNAVAVGPFDRYNVGLVAGDPASLDIQRILDLFDLRVERGNSEGTVQAIQLIESIYFGLGMGPIARRGSEPQPQHLELVLYVLHSAWGRDNAAYCQQLLYGISRFIGGHSQDIDIQRLITRLVEGGLPLNWLGRASGRGQMMSLSSKKAMVGLLEDAYNKGLSKNKLRSIKP